MPNQICVLTRRRSLQIKLLTFTFTNFIEEHVDPGERDEIMIVVMIVPARPWPNSNNCDDSFNQGHRQIFTELGIRQHFSFVQ